MTRILVVTRAFPWLPGEQFVEPEAPFWSRDDCEVVVMPWRIEGAPRPVPDDVRLDDTLSRITARERQLARLRCVIHPLFAREVAWLVRNGRLNRATLTEVVRSLGGALAVRDVLARWIERNGPIDVVYTYWWDVWTYGAQLLKGKGVGHVVTRAHGYDLYEDRHPSGYLALKRSLGRQLDAQLAISHDGFTTAREVYGLGEDIVRMAPLGVRIPDVRTAASPAGELHLVSTAAMAPVKRIDRLVDALGLLCAAHPELRVTWTHFGDGALRAELEQRIVGLADPANLTVTLAGNVPNTTIREHFTNHPVDLFVNTSASEGVPVSIMEAMAFGIPTLAPAVGGIGDIVPVDGPGGALLGEAPEAAQVADALWAWHERAKRPEEREGAAAAAAKDYDEAKNYTGLFDMLVEMAH